MATPIVPVPVLFVSSHARAGGAERYLQLLLEELEPEWIAHVVVLEDGPFAGELRAAGYPTTILRTGARAKSIATSAWRLRKLLRWTKAPVVHANGIKAGLVSVLATLGHPAAVVWVKHDFSWDGPLVRFVGLRAERIVAVSSAVAAALHAQSAKIRVVHNAIPKRHVDPVAGRRAMLEALRGSEPIRVVALVGRLDPVKGHDELLAVVADIEERIPGTRFAFVGGEDSSHPEYAAELKADIRRRGAERLVTFLGHREDVLDLMSGADVIVIPSVRRGRYGREAFPYVALEAMAARTPIVAYADGGLPEAVGDCAVLVSPGDRRAFADALIAVLQDASLREDLVQCGAARLDTEFSLQKTADAMRSVYRETARR